MALNGRQEKFAREVAKGANYTQAMRKAGYACKYPSNSWHITKNHDVKNRIAQLQEKNALKAEVTVQSLTAELDELLRLAKSEKQVAAGVAAIREKAILHGKRVERRETGEAGEFAQLSDDELKDRLASEIADLARGAVPDPASGTEH